MAYSLETACVLPLCLSLLLPGLTFAVRLEREQNLAVRLETMAAVHRSQGSRLYEIRPYTAGHASGLSLQTAPARAIRLILLAEDQWQSLQRWFPGQESHP